MVAWATLRAEWREPAAAADTYSLTVPAAWRAEGAELFQRDGPLPAARLRALNNAKVQRRAMLRVGEALEAVLQPGANFERVLRHFFTDVLRLEPTQAPTLLGASIPQVLGILAAAFDGDAGLPTLNDAVTQWAARYGEVERRRSVSRAGSGSPLRRAGSTPPAPRDLGH
eukprot:gene1064-1657_t